MFANCPRYLNLLGKTLRTEKYEKLYESLHVSFSDIFRNVSFSVFTSVSCNKMKQFTCLSK